MPLGPTIRTKKLTQTLKYNKQPYDVTPGKFNRLTQWTLVPIGPTIKTTILKNTKMSQTTLLSNTKKLQRINSMYLSAPLDDYKNNNTSKT